MPPPQPDVIPSRMMVSTGAWYGLACGHVQEVREPALRQDRRRIAGVRDDDVVERAGDCGPGVVAPIRVELVTDAVALTPPIVTVAPGSNWLPTRLTAVPPDAGPEVPYM